MRVAPFLLTGALAVSLSPPRVAFVFYDAGETLGLRPVISLLAANGTDCTVVCCTENAEQLMAPLRTRPNVQLIPVQRALNLTAPLHRDGQLSARQLSRLLTDPSLHVSGSALVVTGAVSAVQQQLAVALRADTYVVAFDDGFNTWDTTSRVAALVGAGAADELFVTATAIAEAARGAVQPAMLPGGVRALGSPALEAWRDELVFRNRSAARQLRQLVMRAAGGSDSDDGALLLWFGGYGGADYNATVAELGRLALRLAALPPPRRVRVVLTQHPGQGVARDVERSVLATVGAAHVVAVLPPTEQFSSAAVAAISNVTASEDSTCNVQSLFIGTPSLYLQPPCCPGAPHVYGSNVATDAGLLPVAANASAAAGFMRVFGDAAYHFDAAKLTEAGVPQHAAANVAARVAALLQAQAAVWRANHSVEL